MAHGRSPLWPSDPGELRDAEGWGYLKPGEERRTDMTKAGPRAEKTTRGEWINVGN